MSATTPAERLSGPRPRHRTAALSQASMLVAALVSAALVAAANARVSRAHAHSDPIRGCTDADTQASRAPLAVMRAAVLCLINRQRQSRNLPPLRELHRLDRSAQGWTDAMVRDEIFSHTGSGSDPGVRVSAAGYRWSSVGENIATGYRTPRQVVSAWIASSGHCKNILSPDFTGVGTGISTRPVRGFASGAATWTEDFALPAGEHAPSRNWAPADRCPY